MSNVKPPLCGKMGIYAQQLLTGVKYMREGFKGLFINDVIISGEYSRFSLQTTHVLKVHCILSIMGGLKWKLWIPAKNDDFIYEQPLKTMTPTCTWRPQLGPSLATFLTRQRLSGPQGQFSRAGRGRGSGVLTQDRWAGCERKPT